MGKLFKIFFVVLEGVVVNCYIILLTIMTILEKKYLHYL